MAKLRIGVDLDGVVYDFVDAFRQYLTGIGKSGRYPEPSKWEMWDDWGMDKQEWLEHFIAGVESGEIFGRGYPYQGSVIALKLLALQHSIHIVTSRNVHPNAIGLTAQWLAEHGIQFDTLTFSADKTIVPCDIFIEDNVDNAMALRDAGAIAVLMDRPWNRCAPGIRRVTSWGEFMRVVDEH